MGWDPIGASRDGFGGGGYGGFDGDGRGGFGAGGYGAAPSRSQLNSFLGLPSDEGMHGMVNNPYVHGGGGNLGDGINTQHGTWQGPNGGFAAGGSAEGPRGGEAGDGVYVGPNGRSSQAAVRGPDGGEAGRGVVVGPNGVIAAGGGAGPHGGEAAHGVVVGPDGRVAGGGAVAVPMAARRRGFRRGAARLRGRFRARLAVGSLCDGRLRPRQLQHWNYFGPGWYTDHPGRGSAAGWAAGRCWWPALGPRSMVVRVPARSTDLLRLRQHGRSIKTTACMSTASTRARRSEYYNQAQTLATTGAGQRHERRATGCRWACSCSRRAARRIRTTSSNWRSTSKASSAAISRTRPTTRPKPVQGSVDLKTQRVAFTVGDKEVDRHRDRPVQSHEGRGPGAGPLWVRTKPSSGCWCG